MFTDVLNKVQPEFYLGQNSGDEDEIIKSIRTLDLPNPHKINILDVTKGSENYRLLYGERGEETEEDESNDKECQVDLNDSTNRLTELKDVKEGKNVFQRISKVGAASFLGRKGLENRRMSTRSIVRIKTSHDLEDPTPPWVISVNNIWKAWWDTFVDVLVAYSVITSLYFLGFQEPEDSMYLVDHVVRIIFILDIILTFFTDYIDDRGKNDHCLQEIAKNYIVIFQWANWFLFDLIAVIPFREMRYPDVEYFCRMTRAFKIPETLNLIDGRAISLIIRKLKAGDSRDEKNDNGIQSKYATQLITLVVVLLLLCYGLGCFWWWYVDIVRNNPYTEEVFFESKGDNAGNVPDIQEDKYLHQVLAACYFMMTTLTTVGYGDYLALNVPEMAMMCIIMLLGTVVFAYIMGSVDDAIKDYDDLHSGTDKMSDLNMFLDSIELLHGKLGDEIKSEFYEHQSYYWQFDRLRSLAKEYWQEDASDLKTINQEYLCDMEKKTVFQIIKYLYNDIFYDFRYFFGESRFKYYMAFHFQPRKFEPGEYIVKEGEKLEEIYFVYYAYDGVATVGVGPMEMKEGEETHKPLLYFRNPHVIGDYQIIMNTPAITNYRVYDDNTCDTYAVPRQPFMNLLEIYYPENRDIMLGYALKKQNRIQELLKGQISAASKIFGQALKNNFVDAVESLEADKFPFYHFYKKKVLKKEEEQDKEEMQLKMESDYKKATHAADMINESMQNYKEKGRNQRQDLKDRLKEALQYIEGIKKSDSSSQDVNKAF